MTVYEIPHCTVESMVNGNMFRITTESGYYIHLPEHEENIYKTVVILRADYDFSTVQIIAEADLPEGAEILANGNETVTQ